MFFDHFSLSPTERELLKEEAIEIIRSRLGLAEELARRVVARSRSIDQAISLAELMR